MTSDLRERCKEILEWKRTGILSGEHLHNLARITKESIGDGTIVDMGSALQMAENATADEAMAFVLSHDIAKLSASSAAYLMNYFDAAAELKKANDKIRAMSEEATASMREIAELREELDEARKRGDDW